MTRMGIWAIQVRHLKRLTDERAEPMAAEIAEAVEDAARNLQEWLMASVDKDLRVELNP